MRIVIQEWERVLLYRRGRFEELLEAGQHRRRRWRAHAVRVSVRPRLLAIAGQEVLSADGISVRASLLVRCRVGDPRRWYEGVEDPDGFLYGSLQVALREAVGARTLEELVAERGAVGPEIVSLIDAVQLGLVVDEVALRDLMVPTELRRASAEAVTARVQGLAALERARSEVASTRALANAAKLLADSPGLLQLRTLQAIETGRATVVLDTTVNAGRAGPSTKVRP